MVEQTPGRFLTRRHSADFIRNEIGAPFSFSTATKHATQAEHREPAKWWGRRPLYTPDDLRTWFEKRSRSAKRTASDAWSELEIKSAAFSEAQVRKIRISNSGGATSKRTGRDGECRDAASGTSPVQF